jgi:hypothetical protein
MSKPNKPLFLYEVRYILSRPHLTNTNDIQLSYELLQVIVSNLREAYDKAEEHIEKTFITNDSTTYKIESIVDRGGIII